MLRNSHITEYIEAHPAAYEEVVTAVQEIPRPKLLPTPASTPCHTDLLNEQTSTPLPSRQIVQEEELDPDDQSNLHEDLPVEAGDHNLPAVQQESNQRDPSLYHTDVEDGDDSETEQTHDNTQLSANVDAWPQPDNNNDTYDQDARQSGELWGHTVTPLSSNQSGSTHRRSSKRKQHFEGVEASKRAHLELVDAAQARPGSTDPHRSTLFDFRPAHDRNNESPLLQPEMRDVNEADRLSGPAVAESQLRSSKRNSPDSVGPTDEGSDRLAKLPADLRAKVQRIADAGTLANAWHFFDYTRNPVPLKDQSALEQNGGSHAATFSDRRLKQLKLLIESEEETEKSLTTSRIVVRVSKRVHLAELTARYLVEKQAKKAASKMRRDRKLPRLQNLAGSASAFCTRAFCLRTDHAPRLVGILSGPP
jgi:hypothetical protein